MVLVIIVVLCILAPGDNVHFSNEDVTELNSGWQIIDGNGDPASITLPTRLDVSAGEDYQIFIKLNEEFPDNTTLCIRSSLQTLRVLLDEQEIYSQGFHKNTPIYTPVASMWNLIRLPRNTKGKTLRLVFSSPYPSMAGLVNPIIYGSKSAVLFYFMRTYGPGLLIALLILLIGLVLIIISFVIRSILDRGLLYLGLFALFISMWLLAESKCFSFSQAISFISVEAPIWRWQFFPIPMLLYIRETVITHGKELYRVLPIVFLADLISCTALQVLGIASFFETVAVTHSLIIISIVVTSGSLIVEIKKYKNKSAVRFSWCICLLILFATFEFIGFYREDYLNTSVFLRIGLMLYISILGIDSILRLRRLIHKSEEAQFLERMAYEDILTGGKNRAAYVRDLGERLSSANTRNLRLVVMDLNGLKTINDQYGHVVGDDALQKSYQCIRDAFDTLGECYRIGGDEFACILPDCDESFYSEAIHQLKSWWPRSIGK